MLSLHSVQAQTFTVLHTFTGGQDGATPFGGLTLDRAGSLYGTTSAGGYTGNNCTSAGCGTVFKITQRNGGWIFTPLYSFQGNPDSATPYAGVTVGPNGSLYGTTLFGGTGAGTVYNLQPPPRATAHVVDGWSNTVLHTFDLTQQGLYPAYGSLVFDSAGAMYGTTSDGGMGCDDGGYCGTVFKLTSSSGGWTLSSYLFPGGVDGGNPLSGVVLDAAGNLYGTTGLSFNPVAYRLAPSQQGWTETVLHTFDFDDDLRGSVIFDGAGNLFGTSVTTNKVYELSPFGAQWIYTLLYTFSGTSGPWSGVLDVSGDLYGTTCAGGRFSQGSVFKLTPSQSGWSETDLYAFTGGSDGSCPIGGLAIDVNGDLFGTTAFGGGGSCSGRCGTVWKIAP